MELSLETSPVLAIRKCKTQLRQLLQGWTAVTSSMQLSCETFSDSRLVRPEVLSCAAVRRAEG
eukprot:4995150-Pyramimonas_sp.AAC.1